MDPTQIIGLIVLAFGSGLWVGLAFANAGQPEDEWAVDAMRVAHGVSVSVGVVTDDQARAIRKAIRRIDRQEGRA